MRDESLRIRADGWVIDSTSETLVERLEAGMIAIEVTGFARCWQAVTVPKAQRARLPSVAPLLDSKLELVDLAEQSFEQR